MRGGCPLRTIKLDDVPRSVALAAAAVFMLGANTISGIEVVAVANASLPTPIDPAGYAFAIWGAIFMLGVVSSGYQSLSRNRSRPLMRSIGWVQAAAYAFTGFWPFCVALARPELAHLMLLGMAISLTIVYLRIAVSPDVQVQDTWTVEVPVGVHLAWAIVANAVSLTSLAQDGGVIAPGTGVNIASVALLITAGCVVGWFISRGRTGPTALWLSASATIVWAVVGIVVKQWGFSVVGIAAAVGASVASALVGWLWPSNSEAVVTAGADRN